MLWQLKGLAGHKEAIAIAEALSKVRRTARKSNPRKGNNIYKAGIT